MSKITYTDKVALYENTSIADVNKCKADDLNEIKTVINNNDDEVGTLSNLKTTSQNSLVLAINELYNDIFYKSGDDYSSSNTETSADVLCGNITSSSKTLNFVLTVPKSLANITTVNVLVLQGFCRGVNGYLDSQGSTVDYTTSSYTIATKIISDNRILFSLTKSSAFSNATNNTPIALYCQAITLSFS